VNSSLAIAARLALEAGELAAQGRRDQPVVAGTKSSDTDMVTQFDHASEEHIVQRIRELRPHDAIVGEEGSATVGTSGIGWLIDPIDGTTSHVRPARVGGVDHQSTTRVRSRRCTCRARRAVHRRTAEGRPTTVAALAGSIAASAPARHLLVATGFGYAPGARAKQRLAHMIGSIRDIQSSVPPRSTCHVAIGRVDAYSRRASDRGTWRPGRLIARRRLPQRLPRWTGTSRRVLVAAPACSASSPSSSASSGIVITTARTAANVAARPTDGGPIPAIMGPRGYAS
jgi:myo-inositol-1(or 4)-monophosphatase